MKSENQNLCNLHGNMAWHSMIECLSGEKKGKLYDKILHYVTELQRSTWRHKEIIGSNTKW